MTAPADAAAPAGANRVPVECRVVGTVAFVFVVVATPREFVGAFAGYLAVVLAVAGWARVRPVALLRRMTLELPFVAFAAFLPFVGRAPRVDVGPFSLSVSGLWAAWGILAKASLGVAAAALLMLTTGVPELLRGFERLRLPPVLTGIASFMLRYATIVADDLRRMRIARLARGDDPRWLWQLRGYAQTAGAVFVRTYERGERVQVAMLARGGGSAAVVERSSARPRDWLAGLAPAGAALVVLLLAVGLS